jgi:2-polyprenyl-6-methoxyphenol hydroxylase-like FAD-dependent oxidoreductase
MRCIPVGDSWRGVTPTGPCATFPGDDSRVRGPYADGVLLVGDAAGYDNPLQGFGLSMAMRDAREVVGILLSSQSWADEAFSSYIESRARRQRWANVSNALEVWANDGFSVQDPTERAARYAQIRADEILSVHEHLSFTGFDDIPDNVSAEEIEAR